MATATTPLVSVEEYLNTSYEPDCDYVDGELVERNMGELDHSGLQKLVLALLVALEKKLGIYAWPEVRTQVARARFRVPDIAVTTSKPKSRILREPPFLCIEILPPDDRFSRMQQRIEDYLRFGVRHVWVIDPEKRMAWSYTGESRTETTSVLATDDPRIEISLRELFAELDDQVDLSGS